MDKVSPGKVDKVSPGKVDKVSPGCSAGHVLRIVLSSNSLVTFA